MVTVMIVDDQELIRAGLRTIIEAHPGLSIAAEAGDGLSAVREVDRQAADVVLMDLRMPGIDGVEAIRRIRAAHPAPTPRILVLTTFEEDQNVISALRAGADGFLGKGAGPKELTTAILEVAEGRHALSSIAIDALVGHLDDQDAPRPADPEARELFTSLTPRELEVVGAIVEGLDNKQIAERMFLSPFTVKTHANRAMMKVGARDRAQLVSLAVQAGILP